MKKLLLNLTFTTLLLSVAYSQCDESNWESYYPEMEYCDLAGADLAGAYLNYASLFYADLSNADLSNANLYQANLYGANLMNTNLDIVLSDGFVGNITLKIIEGLSQFLFNELEDNLNSNNELLKFKKSFNFELSTLLLGINGIVLKCHGSSSKESFKNAIIEAKNLSKLNIINKINNYI